MFVLNQTNQQTNKCFTSHPTKLSQARQKGQLQTWVSIIGFVQVHDNFINNTVGSFC